MKINTHSFVDVITNSSTEIYISTHDKSIEYVKGIIDNVLKAGQSKFTSDDLFIFQETEKDLTGHYDYYSENELIILPKADLPIEVLEAAKYITSVLQSIFHIDACYNG